jgi:hypothetical protein
LWIIKRVKSSTTASKKATTTARGRIADNHWSCDTPGAIPAPVRDERGLWVEHDHLELSRQNLIRALGYAAEYIHGKGENIIIVTVGGAVNAILLESRATTHNVDFFSERLSDRRVQLLRAAGRYAVERSSVPLSDDWLNNATARIGGVVENIEDLLQQALEQDRVVFGQPGLKHMRPRGTTLSSRRSAASRKGRAASTTPPTQLHICTSISYRTETGLLTSNRCKRGASSIDHLFLK